MRRAERRGKKLPEILEKTLKQQIERWRKYGSPLPVFFKDLKFCITYDGEGITSKVNASNPQIGDPCHTLGRTGAGRTLLCQCYDARGNGDGKVVPTITGDHNHRISDYTALLVENKAFSIDPLSSNSMKSSNPHSGFHETSIAKCLDTSDGSPNKNQGGTVIVQGYVENSSGDGISGTIDASYYKGVGSREGKEREFVVCETLGFNPLNGAKAASNAEVENGSSTLRSSSPTACVICFSQDAYDKYEETEHGATLRASGGIYGGGSENLVCKPVYCLQGNGIDRADTAGCNGKGVTENVSYTLNTVDRHAVCCEAEGHPHDFLVRMRESKDGGGKGALVQEDKSGTIACNNDQVLFQMAETQYIVRRLTPLECCRLQGMPDFWTDGVEGSDAARYKLWGNGMALPNALYVMEGIAEVGNGR